MLGTSFTKPEAKRRPKANPGLSDISITKQTDKASSNLGPKNSANENKMTTPPSAGILRNSGSGVPSYGQSNKPKDK
jgi:hypothetical protein